jgi:putative phage-type endonuclease
VAKKTTTKLYRPVAAPLTPAWYKARRTGIGSSEAAEAVGRSLERTSLDLYNRKIGLVPEFDGNTDTRIGRAIEPVIKLIFREQLHKEFSDGNPPMVRSLANPFMMATCDSFVGDDEIFEAKWTSNRKFKYGWQPDPWGEQGTDQIPEEVILQAQQQMSVTGRKRVWVGVLVECNFRVYVVEREDELIDWLVSEERGFWDRVLDRDPPSVAPDHKAALRAVQALYRGKIEPFGIHLSPEVDKLRQRLEGLREAETAIGKEISACKTAILAEMGTAEYAIGSDGSGLKRCYVKASEYTVKRDEAIMLKRAKLPKQLLLKDSK